MCKCIPALDEDGDLGMFDDDGEPLSSSETEDYPTDGIGTETTKSFYVGCEDIYLAEADENP